MKLIKVADPVKLLCDIKSQKEKISIPIDNKIVYAVETIAEQNDMPLGEVIEEIIIDWLDRLGEEMV